MDKDRPTQQHWRDPDFLYGMLLAQQKLLLSVALMHATIPELQEEVLPTLQHLHDGLVAEPISEALLQGIEQVQRAVQRLPRVP